MKYFGLVLVLLFILSTHSAYADSCEVKGFSLTYKDMLGRTKTEKLQSSKQVSVADPADCQKITFEAEFNQCYDFVNRQVALLSTVFISRIDNKIERAPSSFTSCDYVLNVRRPEGMRVADDPGKG